MLHLHPDLVEMKRAENFVPLSVEIERESEILGAGGRRQFRLAGPGSSSQGRLRRCHQGDRRTRQDNGGTRRARLLATDRRDQPLSVVADRHADGIRPAATETEIEGVFMAFSVADISQAEAFRISPKDTNYFVMLFDKDSDKIDNIFVIEIFKAGGATPPNEHAAAHEFFHVLHGEGVARCDGKTLPIKKGDSLLLHPGSEHVIENTGAGKLYTLTVMTPNEGFAELIRGGERVELDADDIRILQGS
jgi:mannose-6-phosphate isomerase-like protein (cupin superfamily)